MPAPINIVNPFLPVRGLRDDEIYVTTAFEHHADHCKKCNDPLRTHEKGKNLCTRGIQYANDVASYLYSKRGKSYSVVDHEHKQPTLVKIPRDSFATRSLLLAIEDGLYLHRERPSTKPVQKPVISYDRTYHVPPRLSRSRSQRFTEIIEREPRTPHVKTRRILVYPSPRRSRSSSTRSSPSRGSLYDADAADRVERVKESSRVYRPAEYHR